MWTPLPDFEEATAHVLTVRVSDAYGGELEKNFTIEVVDAFLPIVYTCTTLEVGETHLVATGEVMDEGGSSGVAMRAAFWWVSAGSPKWETPG